MVEKKKVNNWGVTLVLTLMNWCYAPGIFAADWFPKVAVTDDMTKGGIMKVVISEAKTGLMILLFFISVALFVKFISTVSHGIEEAKKVEGGSLAVFANYAVMGVLYLSMGIASAYVGYTMITNFSI